MSKLLLLYSIFVIGLIYLILPDFKNAVDFFPFYDMRLNPATHIYFIGEKITMIILSYLIYNEAVEYKGALQVFFIIMIADLVDYLLCYGSVWYDLEGFPVSMNTVKCLVFGFTILYVWSKDLSK